MGERKEAILLPVILSSRPRGEPLKFPFSNPLSCLRSLHHVREQKHLCKLYLLFLEVRQFGLFGGTWTFRKVWEESENAIFSKTNYKIVPFLGHIILTSIYTWLHSGTKQIHYVWGPIFTFRFGGVDKCKWWKKVTRIHWQQFASCFIVKRERFRTIHHLRHLNTWNASGVSCRLHVVLSNVFNLKLRNYKLWRSQGRNTIFGACLL